MCSRVSPGRQGDLRRFTIGQWSVTREREGLEQARNCAVGVTREGDLSRVTIVQWSVTRDREGLEQIHNCAVECH